MTNCFCSWVWETNRKDPKTNAQGKLSNVRVQNYFKELGSRIWPIPLHTHTLPRQQGVQAILVTTESDFLYYSGFMSQVILLFAIVHVTGSKNTDSNQLVHLLWVVLGESDPSVVLGHPCSRQTDCCRPINRSCWNLWYLGKWFSFLSTVKVPERVRFWHEKVHLSANHSSSCKKRWAVIVWRYGIHSIVYFKNHEIRSPLFNFIIQIDDVRTWSSPNPLDDGISLLVG